MKMRTAILVIGLAAMAVKVGWGETVTDRNGKVWTCRTLDDSIYTLNGVGDHIYNIQAAHAAGEYDKAARDKGKSSKAHDPICINPVNGRIIWWWPTAKNIKPTFTPLTEDGKTCQTSKHPFRSDPDNSKDKDFLVSDWAQVDFSECAYEVSFTSSLGSYDPHIIIKGASSALVTELEGDLKRLEKAIEDLRAQLKQSEAQKN
jgi:hypothetical protein